MDISVPRPRRSSVWPNGEFASTRPVRTAPWTLTSHASFFTGRWPHELDIKWLTPLRKNFPMLAEYLAAHGYATAGIVSNAAYCSYDTGLDRGFTHYEDYVLERTQLSSNVRHRRGGSQDASSFSGLRHDIGPHACDARMAAAVVPIPDSKRCGIDQSRISRLARPPARSRTALLRLSQLPRCPYAVRGSVGARLTASAGSPRPTMNCGSFTTSGRRIDKLQLPRHYLTTGAGLLR